MAHTLTDLCISFWVNEKLGLVHVLTCVFIHVASFLLMCSVCLVIRESARKPLGEASMYSSH